MTKHADLTREQTDELIKRLREHGRAWGVTAETADVDVFNETSMARDCCRAADALQSLTSQNEGAKGWIPVSAGMPLKGERVLATGFPAGISDGGRWVRVIAYLGIGWASFDEQYPMHVPPTHWMPLPPPPGDDSRDAVPVSESK